MIFLPRRYAFVAVAAPGLVAICLHPGPVRAQQAAPQDRDEVGEMKDCFERIDAVSDAVKGQPADFNTVLNFFVTHYGKPKKMENDSQYLTMGYDKMVQMPGADKPQHTMISYKFHYETSTTRALFGLVSSTSEPFLLGECSFSFTPTYSKAK